METTAALAPQIDRLVWAVRDEVRDRQSDLPASSRLSWPTFNPLINLRPFADELSESLIRRRYLYRGGAELDALLAELETGGYVTRDRDGDRLHPTDRLAPILDEIGRATADGARRLWQDHEPLVEAASPLARQVMEAAPVRDGLTQAALRAPEPSDVFHRLWQRLAGLRLLRNEAHVGAWRAMGLVAADVEALTNAWAGSQLQAPLVLGQGLVDRGYVHDGVVTEAGLAARQQIEDATNDGVASAFAVIDRSALLEMLTALPPHPGPRA